MIQQLAKVVLFGATGDLSRRYLLPALGALVEARGVDRPLEIIGVGRKEMDDAAFRALVEKALEKAPAAARAALCERARYRQADAGEPGDVARVFEGVDEPVLVYLALPPSAFAPAVTGLERAKLEPGSLVVLEKPFGTDAESARALNAQLARSFSDDAVFRMDHFLGKQTVLNLLGLRFANRIFAPVWSAEHVARVDITFDETIAVEGRMEFYDATGALRDMIQNHLLQLLCLVAMEAPASCSGRDLQQAKATLFRAVRRLDADEVAAHTLRGRYTAGHGVRGYADEKGIDRARETETFAQVTLFVDNARWRGVPFTLRSGKALDQDKREIAIAFRPGPDHTFGAEADARPNVLRLSLKPDTISLGFNVNGPGEEFDLERLDLVSTLAPHPLPDYARLLCDALHRDTTLSISGPETVECWEIVEPILAAWRKGKRKLGEYAAGSAGPT